MLKACKPAEGVQGLQGVWEREWTRVELTLSPAYGGGWDLVWPAGGWLGRVYTAGIRTAVDLGAPDRLHIDTRAGRAPSGTDRDTIRQICMSLLPQLDALEAAR